MRKWEGGIFIKPAGGSCNLIVEERTSGRVRINELHSARISTLVLLSYNMI